jgi:hypothetical protein
MFFGEMVRPVCARQTSPGPIGKLRHHTIGETEYGYFRLWARIVLSDAILEISTMWRSGCADVKIPHRLGLRRGNHSAYIAVTKTSS